MTLTSNVDSDRTECHACYYYYYYNYYYNYYNYCYDYKYYH